MEKWKSESKFHGVMTVLLFYTALAIGCVVVFRQSTLFGFVDIALATLWPIPVAWFFCAKCPCRLDCGHVFMGAITRLLPEKKPGKYSLGEEIGSLLPMLIAAAFPLYWLLRDVTALIAFLALLTLTIIETRLGVCVACPNEYCRGYKG